MFAGVSRFELNHQWTGRVEGFFDADVLYSLVPHGAKVVKSKRILFFIDYFNQSLLHFHKLGRVDLALEDGKLNSLPIIKTDFGHASKTFGTALGGGGDIVGDENVHRVVGDLQFEIAR